MSYRASEKTYAHCSQPRGDILDGAFVVGDEVKVNELEDDGRCGDNIEVLVHHGEVDACVISVKMA